MIDDDDCKIAMNNTTVGSSLDLSITRATPVAIKLAQNKCLEKVL